MKKNSLHKTLLVLLLVFIPPYFLIFTEEGTRMADNVLLWVIGGESIEFNLRELDGRFTRDEILQVFPDQQWQCQQQQSPFGDALCAASISAFNDYPAKYLTVFFVADRVTAMKVVYRRSYHDQVLGHLIEQLGQPANAEQAVKADPAAATVLEWQLANGATLVMQRHAGEQAEPSFLWLAAR